MENNEKVEVRAYRGYYVNMDNIIPVITQLLVDADQRKAKIVIIGNDEKAKLDGAIMSLRALKEALYNLEVFGDLIPQPEALSLEEVKPDETAPVKNPVDVVPEDTKDKPV